MKVLIFLITLLISPSTLLAECCNCMHLVTGQTGSRGGGALSAVYRGVLTQAEEDEECAHACEYAYEDLPFHKKAWLYIDRIKPCRPVGSESCDDYYLEPIWKHECLMTSDAAERLGRELFEEERRLQAEEEERRAEEARRLAEERERERIENEKALIRATLKRQMDSWLAQHNVYQRIGDKSWQCFRNEMVEDQQFRSFLNNITNVLDQSEYFDENEKQRIYQELIDKGLMPYFDIKVGSRLSERLAQIAQERQERATRDLRRFQQIKFEQDLQEASDKRAIYHGFAGFLCPTQYHIQYPPHEPWKRKPFLEWLHRLCNNPPPPQQNPNLQFIRENTQYLQNKFESEVEERAYIKVANQIRGELKKRYKNRDFSNLASELRSLGIEGTARKYYINANQLKNIIGNSLHQARTAARDQCYQDFYSSNHGMEKWNWRKVRIEDWETDIRDKLAYLSRNKPELGEEAGNKLMTLQRIFEEGRDYPESTKRMMMLDIQIWYNDRSRLSSDEQIRRQQMEGDRF